MRKVCYQINLQGTLGGGEIYTRSLTSALSSLGWRTVTLVAREATFWPELLGSQSEIRRVSGGSSLLQALPPEPSLIITHTALAEELASTVAARHRLTGIAHMPLFERDPRGLHSYHRVFAVSEHVRESAVARGLPNVHPEPLYAVADLQSRPGTLRGEGSLYEWDRRKLRDRLFGLVESMYPPQAARRRFERFPGLTLGLVSRLTPIKQFPMMFAALAPIIGEHPDVRIEVFGAGGYASVRDLSRAMVPIKPQVRFWGRQSDVSAIYPKLDYTLSGLPEKEALGLNLIESQICGTPVLAVRAPPFTETVLDGVSGFLFEDPRRDNGADFGRLLKRIGDSSTRPDPRKAIAHLARFSMAAFTARVERAMASVAG
jgi:glycosyltransferase involved in cell wall biosynthesis